MRFVDIDRDIVFNFNRAWECLKKDNDGNLSLTVTLPDPSLLGNLAGSLSRLLTTPSLSALQ